MILDNPLAATIITSIIVVLIYKAIISMRKLVFCTHDRVTVHGYNQENARGDYIKCNFCREKWLRRDDIMPENSDREWYVEM